MAFRNGMDDCEMISARFLQNGNSQSHTDLIEIMFNEERLTKKLSFSKKSRVAFSLFAHAPKGNARAFVCRSLFGRERVSQGVASRVFGVAEFILKSVLIGVCLSFVPLREYVSRQGGNVAQRNFYNAQHYFCGRSGNWRVGRAFGNSCEFV